MNIECLIQQVQKRPGMFVGCIALEPVCHFISGFLYNNIVTNRADHIDIMFKEQFHEWVRIEIEKKYNIQYEKNHNYLYYITKTCQDSKQSLEEFFVLCNSFFKMIHDEV